MHTGYDVFPGKSFSPPVAIPSVIHPNKYIVYYTYYETPGREGMIYWYYVNCPGNRDVFDAVAAKKEEEAQKKQNQQQYEADERKAAFSLEKVFEFGIGVGGVAGCGFLVANNLFGEAGQADDYLISVWWERAMQGFSTAFSMG